MIIHRISGILLLVSHLSFLFRSRILLKSGRGPRTADRFLMLLSQILLPVTILSGIPGIGKTKVLHVILGLMPVAMMFILSRRSLRRRHPLLLPLVNGLFLAAAFLTGLWFH